MSNKSNLQSNNDSLSANNLDLQNLIDQANALPDVGGGSGGFPAVTVTALEGTGDTDGMIIFSEEDAAKLDAATQTPGPIFLTVSAGDETVGFTFRALMSHTVVILWDNTANVYVAPVYYQDTFTMIGLTKTEDSVWTMITFPMTAGE